MEEKATRELSLLKRVNPEAYLIMKNNLTSTLYASMMQSAEKAYFSRGNKEHGIYTVKEPFGTYICECRDLQGEGTLILVCRYDGEFACLFLTDPNGIILSRREFSGEQDVMDLYSSLEDSLVPLTSPPEVAGEIDLEDIF